MGLLDRGQALINRALPVAGGVSVVYVRGLVSVTLTAVVGRTAFAQISGAGGGQGAAVVWGDRDYLVRVADLILSGSPVSPQKGDRIQETIDGTLQTFEVLAPGGEPAWRYSDQGRTLWRIHTKRVAP